MHQLDPTNNRGWIALNMARFTWPALHTQFVRHLSTPDTIQRLCQGGITPLEPLLPGLSEKLAAIQRSHALSHELTRLQTATFPLLFRLGVSPRTLARWYGQVR